MIHEDMYRQKCTDMSLYSRACTAAGAVSDRSGLITIRRVRARAAPSAWHLSRQKNTSSCCCLPAAPTIVTTPDDRRRCCCRPQDVQKDQKMYKNRQKDVRQVNPPVPPMLKMDPFIRPFKPPPPQARARACKTVRLPTDRPITWPHNNAE